MDERTRILRYLESEFTDPIRDPLWKHIYLTPGFKKLVNSAPFLKLAGIKQLGVAYLVYPGATHTRLAHSLGVFHLATRMARGLLGSAPEGLLTREGVAAFLTAALLHDLGHFPFTHSLKELPLRDHETLTADHIVSTPLSDLIRDAVGIDPGFPAAIVDESRPATTEIKLFRAILSGVLDPDKLDYLNRDAYFCGVPYGIQDIDVVVSRMRLSRNHGVVIEPQGIHAIEHLLFSKYLMYRTVYWHKTVRIATAMIKKAVYLALRDGAVEAQNLYGLDDEEFFRVLGRRALPQFELIRRVARRELLGSAFEAPFDETRFGRLLPLSTREEAEARIAAELTRAIGTPVDRLDVVIDVPERISFEVDVGVSYPDGSVVPYTGAGAVFSQEVVSGFVSTIRTLRVAVPKHVAAAAAAVIEDCL